MFVSRKTRSAAVVAINVLAAKGRRGIDQADRMGRPVLEELSGLRPGSIFPEHKDNFMHPGRDVRGNRHRQGMIGMNYRSGGHGTHGNLLRQVEALILFYRSEAVTVT